MKIKAVKKWNWGYTMSEVILAIGVVGLTVPVFLALVIAGGETSQQAEIETRAVFTARTLFEEVRLAEEGLSELVYPEELPWKVEGSGEASGSEEWLIFEVDVDGDLLGLVDGMSYENRYTGDNPDTVTIAAVRGYEEVLEGTALGQNEPVTVFRLEVRIETPARAVVEDRKSEVFLKTYSLK